MDNAYLAFCLIPQTLFRWRTRRNAVILAPGAATPELVLPTAFAMNDPESIDPHMTVDPRTPTDPADGGSQPLRIGR
jgi:hypothetical protein